MGGGDFHGSQVTKQLWEVTLKITFPLPFWFTLSLGKIKEHFLKFFWGNVPLILKRFSELKIDFFPSINL